jgi:hypothetical protein
MRAGHAEYIPIHKPLRRQTTVEMEWLQYAVAQSFGIGWRNANLDHSSIAKPADVEGCAAADTATAAA